MDNLGLIITIGLGFFGIIVSMLSMLIISHKEMKDFHGRLCTIEEQYVQMMERHLEKPIRRRTRKES